MYGVDAGGALPFYVTLGLASFAAGGIFGVCQKHLSLAYIAVVWNLGAILALPLMVHLADLTDYNSAGSLMAGYAVWLSLGWITFTAHRTLLSMRLPKQVQARFVPIIETFGQAGRAVGPIIFTQTYAIANQLEPGSAPNVSLLSQLLIFIGANALPLFFFTEMYGRFGDGPLKPPVGARKELV